ncbi:hypothetical protein BH11PLA1_BH11PLA1_11390 [soil metagenome]
MATESLQNPPPPDSSGLARLIAAATQPRSWGRSLMSRVRLRAAFFTLGIVAATWAAILLTSFAWAPIVGVAAVAVAVSVSKATKVLRRPVCLQCGHDLSGQTPTTYGIHCPACGSLKSG